MIIEGKTIYVCDFCRCESERKDFGNNLECGSATLSISGNYGSKMIDQSWGGNNFKMEADLCFSCSKIVISELDKIKQSFREIKDLTK